MTRSPTLLLRSLLGEPPMLELPLGHLFRRAYVHAQYESGDLSGSDSVAIPSKQRAASWAALCNYYLKNESLRLVGRMQSDCNTSSFCTAAPQFRRSASLSIG